jgi:plastocyanin domain-containing protein
MTASDAKESDMSGADIVVVLVAVLAIATMGWYFFAPRRGHTAAVSGGVQRVRVTVRGGYSPNVVQVRQGLPVEIEFDRQESGDCTSRVVFPKCSSLPGCPPTNTRPSDSRPNKRVHSGLPAV